MVPPFRDDAWRAHRAEELEVERERLQRERLANETRIVALHRKRLRVALGHVWSVFGAIVLVSALAGGFAVGRWLLSDKVHACE